MKVFELNHGDDKEWIGADSLQQAMEWYEEDGSYGLDGTEIWMELDDKEIDNMKVDLSHFQEEAPDDGWPDSMSIRDFVKECMLPSEIPGVICSTNFPD